MKKQILLILTIFSFSHFVFAQSEFSELKLRPETDIFFTQTENAYVLTLPEIHPSQIEMTLPDLPHGMKFSSSKKEEIFFESGKKGTQITLIFTFSEAGFVQPSPLLVKISGEAHYFEFEEALVKENPNLVTPILEISFQNPKNLTTDKKSGKKILTVRAGEKISFLVRARYAVEITKFSVSIPQDSIFTEMERFDFAKGLEKLTTFTSEAKNLARFEWKILKTGTFSLPEITVEAVSYSGQKSKIPLSDEIEIHVTEQDEKSANSYDKKTKNKFLEEAYKIDKIDDEKENSAEEKILTKEDFKTLRENTKLSLFDRIFFRKYAIFAGGEIKSIPEEKTKGTLFSGGQKVRIKESAGNWRYVECPDFSGWTESENLFEIK